MILVKGHVDFTLQKELSSMPCLWGSLSYAQDSNVNKSVYEHKIGNPSESDPPHRHEKLI